MIKNKLLGDDRCDFNGSTNVISKSYRYDTSFCVLQKKTKKQAAGVTRDNKIIPSFPDFQQCE